MTFSFGGCIGKTLWSAAADVVGPRSDSRSVARLKSTRAVST
jgi:hypothetical protein